MLTEKDYCDYDTCVALKELGYNEKSNWWFSKYLNEDSGQMELVHICDNPAHLNYDSWGIVPKDFVIRPSLYEAQKWLREEKEVYVTVIPEYNDFRPVKGVKYRLEVAHWKDDEFGYETIEWLDEECPHTIITFDSFEEALLEGIKEAIKILKEERK